tara:strand:- start:929 stop:1237 length:309 start_codon:yes stop_codon:yes gene_type:complete
MTTKAKILPSELAKFMGLKKGQAKQLKPYCEAAKDICNAFAATDLDEGHCSEMAMLLTAAWLQQTGATTPEEFEKLPLKVRYYIEMAKESMNPCASGNCPVD